MYLLDTNTVIDFCNKKLPQNAKNFLVSIQPVISVITHIELFASSKISEKETIQLEQFVQIAIVYDTINIEIIKRAIAIRQQHKTPLPDAIIAATSLVYNCTLIARNKTDFKNIEGLRIIDPYDM